MNKKFKISLSIIIGALAFSLAFYFGVKGYFSANPIIVCGDDKYSEACLAQYALDLKLDVGQYVSCLRADNYSDNISADVDDGSALGLADAPSIFIGEFKEDKTTFVGWYVSVASYEELAELTDNIMRDGVVQAQKINAEVIRERVNTNVREYLASQNLTGAEFNRQLNDLQDDIEDYLQSFQLFSFTSNYETVRGNENSKYGFLYFADYAAELTPQFYSILLQQLNLNYINNNKVKLAIKDLPLSNTFADSKYLANAARCAGAQNKYFEYSDILHSI